MSKELSYLDPEGYTIFTSEFHRKRGRCCQSSCLHCPFGHTIKKHGLGFKKIDQHDEIIVSQILVQKNVSIAWKDFLPDNALILTLKGISCGLVLKNHIVVKELILKEEFSHQGISKELVEAYLF